MSRGTTFISKFGLTEGQAIDNILAVYDRATDEDKVSGHNWYEAARLFSQELGRKAFPNMDRDGQLRLGASIVALFSPRCSWGRNMALATAFVNGEVVKAMGQSVRKAEEAALLTAQGHDPLDAVKGPKVSAFARAIAGIPTNPVIDVWALGIILGRRANEVDYGRVARQYDEAAALYNAAAALLGIDVHSLQAVTWVTFRRESGEDWRDNA